MLLLSVYLLVGIGFAVAAGLMRAHANEQGLRPDALSLRAWLLLLLLWPAFVLLLLYLFAAGLLRAARRHV